jgi:hypothetical protein
MTSANDNPQDPMNPVSDAEPIAEAVLIRRRAQAAEQELAHLKAERQRLQSENQALAEQLDRLRTEQQIRQAAEAAGAVDSETVCLLVRQQMTGEEPSDIPAVLEKLRREKSWLFAPGDSVRPMRSGGQRVLPDRSAALQQAAEKAGRSGRLNDVQEYLRMRRQVV